MRSQDAPGIITAVTGSLIGRDMAWKFFQNNYEELARRYANDTLIGRLVKMTSNYATEEKAIEVEEYFKTRQDALGVARAVQQSVENIRVMAKWLNKDGEKIKQFLSSQEL